MPQIYVNTDNSDASNRIYHGGKAGKSAAKVEAKMQATVEGYINKGPAGDQKKKPADFTTTVDGKGYTVSLEISKLEITGNKTFVVLSGSIVRYPKSDIKSGAKGDEMVTTNWTGKAAADGTSEGSLLDAVEAIVESMMPIGISAMRTDMSKR